MLANLRLYFFACIQSGTKVLDKFRFGFYVAPDDKIIKLVTEPLSEWMTNFMTSYPNIAFENVYLKINSQPHVGARKSHQSPMIDPLGTMDILFLGNSSNSYWDISVLTKVVDQHFHL